MTATKKPSPFAPLLALVEEFVTAFAEPEPAEGEKSDGAKGVSEEKSRDVEAPYVTVHLTDGNSVGIQSGVSIEVNDETGTLDVLTIDKRVRARFARGMWSFAVLPTSDGPVGELARYLDHVLRQIDEGTRAIDAVVAPANDLVRALLR